MTSIPFTQVDAFAHAPFTGNPAAVMPLESWLDDAVLQGIAAENNLAETAFLVKLPEGAGADYELRWFTPTIEVALCGHATLASGHVLMGHAPSIRELRAQPGRAVTRERLAAMALPESAGATGEGLEVLVYRVRKKLGGTGAQLTTLRGLGYLVQEAPGAS